MMHRDTKETDVFEVLCSIPAMTVQRVRMRGKKVIEGLESADVETALVPLAGSLDVKTGAGGSMSLEKKDVCYLGKGTKFSLAARGDADVLLARAPADNVYPTVVKKFSEVKEVVSGVEGYRRRIYTSFGDKDQANRLIVGFVEGDSGNWTSFPPHKHDGKPEVYVYYGMGNRFGVQVVAGSEDEAFVVREGDAVLFENGYHPNVATPGVGMNFVWIISADPKDRNLAVEIHPEYKDMPTGQTHLTVK